ncbi:MAG: hypothetical protein J6N19_15880, partial [Clostridium sp.]|nr:hypothetical protein [Clostridium sp.]
MTVEYNKGTACPILLSNKEWAIALTVHSAKKLQEDLAKIIERAEKEPEMSEFEKCVKRLMEETIEAGDTHNLKPDSEMLLRMAKQQLLQSGELMTQEHHEKLMETLNKAHEEELEKA